MPVGLITGSPQDAPDAVQDAIVGFLAKPPKHESLNLGAWITVVACNRIRDLQRKKGAEIRALEKLGEPDEVSVEHHDRLDTDIVRALRSLPEKQREVCVLHYVLDKPLSEIATTLGVSEGTIKTQLHRVRTVLATLVERVDHNG